MVFWRDNKSVKWKDAGVKWLPHYEGRRIIDVFEGITNSITTFFKALAIIKNFVVRYDNDPGETPTDKIWVKVGIDFGDSHQVEIGVKTFRNVGIFNVQIKIPIGIGSADGLNVADIIATAFRTTIVDETINFQVPRIEKVGRVEDNYQVNVICPFQVDN